MEKNYQMDIDSIEGEISQMVKYIIKNFKPYEENLTDDNINELKLIFEGKCR